MLQYKKPKQLLKSTLALIYEANKSGEKNASKPVKALNLKGFPQNNVVHTKQSLQTPVMGGCPGSPENRVCCCVF